MSDHPIDEVLDNMARLAAQGHDCYVKYTCEKCGSRQTADEPNTWHAAGYICEECGHLTKPTGINFLAVMNVAIEVPDENGTDG